MKGPVQVADVVCQVFLDWGVRRVFSCPGSTEVDFLDALHRHPELELVLTTHESVAVAMADGWARSTGEPGVVWLHANVGLVNGLANLYAAQLANSPVVVINGIKTRGIQNRAGFTSATHTLDFTRQTVKWQWESKRSRDVPADLTRALGAAVASPAGPTYLAIAEDLLDSAADVGAPDARRWRVWDRTRPSDDAISRAAEALSGAQRPIVVAGAGVGTGDVPAVLAIADQLDAPIFAEERWTVRRSTVPTDHPRYAGCYRTDDPLAARSDAVLIAGARTFTSFIERERRPFPDEALVVHLHPDASEMALADPVDVALVGDVGLGLSALQLALSERPRTSSREPREVVRPAPLPVDAAPGSISSHQAMRVLDEVLDDDVIVVGDPVTATDAVIAGLIEPRSRDFHLSGTGALGWGMGAALGVALGHPGRRVVAVVGDGVVQFGLPALWSASRMGLPVTYVVLNNQSYGAVKAALVRRDGESVERDAYPGVDISGVDLSVVAAGFGLSSVRVTSSDALKSRAPQYLSGLAPSLIEVMIDRDDIGPIAR